MPLKSTVQSPAIKTRAEALEQQNAELQAQIEANQKRLDFFNSMPQDEYETGAIVVFEKRFSAGGIKYTYAAVKGGDYWYLSGDTSRRSWDGLLEFMYLNVSTSKGGFCRAYYVSEITGISE